MLGFVAAVLQVALVCAIDLKSDFDGMHSHTIEEALSDITSETIGDLTPPHPQNMNEEALAQLA